MNTCINEGNEGINFLNPRPHPKPLTQPHKGLIVKTMSDDSYKSNSRS